MRRRSREIPRADSMVTIGTIGGLPSAVVPAIRPEHTLAVSKPGDGDPVTGLYFLLAADRRRSDRCRAEARHDHDADCRVTPSGR